MTNGRMHHFHTFLSLNKNVKLKNAIDNKNNICGLPMLGKREPIPAGSVDGCNVLI